jgi:hypothetical protein
VELESELEATVWSVALRAYGASLHQVLEQALAQYKRQPGLDELTRLHSSTGGQAGVRALGCALSKEMPNWGDRHRDDYIEIRRRLRWHIARHLHLPELHAKSDKSNSVHLF